MGRRWPDDVRASVVGMLRAGSTCREITNLYEAKGAKCPRPGTMRGWAAEEGVSIANAANPAPRVGANRPPVLKAEDLPDGVRKQLEGFFEKGLRYLDSHDAVKDARNTKALTDSMANLLALAPDLLTYKERLKDDGGSSDSSANEARVLRSMGLPAEGDEE